MGTKANYDRICTDCFYHSRPNQFHRCSVARNLVSGEVFVQDCGTNRSAKGCCGPEGSRWSPAPAIGVVTELDKARQRHASKK